MKVLAIEKQASGVKTALGTTPRYEDLDWSGLDFSAEQFKQVTSLDQAAWNKELDSHKEFFKSFLSFS